MPRSRSRRRSFGATVRRARPIVRAIVGHTLVKRINVDKETISDITSVDYDNPITVKLIECTESIEEADESTGPTANVVADVPLYSRVIGLRLQANIIGSQAVANQYRWILFKSPDDDITGAVAMANWMSSDDTTAAREVRANTLAKGLSVINQSSGNAFPRIFVRRTTLRRLGAMRENDTIKFAIAKDAPGTTAQLTLWGNVYVRANA